MAKKSKTQRAKASAARAAKKEAQAIEASAAENVKEAVDTAAEAPKKKLFSKAEEAATSADKQATKAVEKSVKTQKKPTKQRFQFLKDVRSELKRVTWPSREDVIQWSIVVVCALLFFGIYVAILDNAIITPLLIAISGLGA